MDISKNTLVCLKTVVKEGARKQVAHADPFGKVKQDLLNVRRRGGDVIVKDRYQADTYVVSLDYIGDRWARGHTTSLTGEEETQTPFTINYIDVIVEDVKLEFVY